MASIVAAWFNVAVCVVLPTGILAYLVARKKSLVLPFLVGILTFAASQLFTRLPLLSFLNTKAWFITFTMTSPALYYLLLGLSAGVFEEAGRYVAMRLMRRHQTFPDAVSFGLGHGGLEAGIIGVNNLMLILLRPATLLALPPISGVALAGIERLIVMAAHVGLSVMVMRSVAFRKPIWLLWAVLVHGLLDAGIGLIPMLFGGGTWAVEGWTLLIAAGLLLYALLSRKRFSCAVEYTSKEAYHEKDS